MNSFKIDYDKKHLTLLFEGETFEFDLNSGDVGEFWHAFETKDKVGKDINFHQEDKNQKPGLSVYGLKLQDGFWNTNTSDEIYIETCETVGNPDNYFGTDNGLEYDPTEKKEDNGDL